MFRVHPPRAACLRAWGCQIWPLIHLETYGPLGGEGRARFLIPLQTTEKAGTTIQPLWVFVPLPTLHRLLGWGDAVLSDPFVEH